MNVYVLVDVYFDYHTFQNNLFASINKQDCYDYAKKNHPEDLLFEDNLTDIECKRLRDDEIRHLLIQKF